MAIKHDATIPYLEIGRLQFHAFIPDLSVPNRIDLTIKKNVENPFIKVFEVHSNGCDIPTLVRRLKTESVETVFSLKSILSKAEVAQISEKKAEILNYFTNLERHYGWPNA